MKCSGRIARCWAAVLLLALGVLPAVAVPARAADQPQLVLVLDSSGSMKEKVRGDRKIDVAKSALKRVADQLPPTSQVGLRVYGATVFNRGDAGACTDSQLVVPIGTNNRPALRAAIARYKPYGETPISYSLKQAARDLGKSGQRTIVLVSDGEETCNADPCDTAASIAKSGISLKIDVIGLAVKGRARSQLRCVAERGNGTYYDADSPTQIEDSLQKTSTRAFRPFTLSGSPVEGATDQDSAPTVAPGRYVDNVPGDDSHVYYRIRRTRPGSTLHASVTALTGSANAGAYTAELTTAQASRCGSGYGSGIALFRGGKAVVSAAVSSWVDDAKSPCSTESSLLLDVGASAGSRGQKFELLVTEEPPVTSTRRLPPPDDSTRWQPLKPAKQAIKAPVAGTSFSDAPVLAPGTFRGSVLTGENQVFAVNSDWGQRVEVEVTIPPRRGALAKESDYGNVMSLKFTGALRGTYPLLSIAGMPQSALNWVEDEKTYRLYAGTPEVRYLNRTDSKIAPAAIAGPQYLVLTMAQDTDRQFLLPYTLTVKVIGTAGEGKPGYAAESSASTTPSPTPSPTPATSASASTSAGASAASSSPEAPAPGGGVSLGTVLGVAVGALLLGAGGPALAVRRRRVQPRP